jgi:hypothetical protein
MAFTLKVNGTVRSVDVSTLNLAGKFKPADNFAGRFQSIQGTRVQDRVAIGVL